MGRSEDYLDSLLDSLNEPKKAEEIDFSDITNLDDLMKDEEASKAPEKRTPDTEASYLDAFERELEEELGESASDFLRDFEEDLGIEPDEYTGDADGSFSDNSGDNSDFGTASHTEAVEANVPVTEASDSSVSGSGSNEASDDISYILGAAFGDDELNSSVDSVVNDAIASASETAENPPAEPGESSVPAEEEEEDFISDIDDGDGAPAAEEGTEPSDSDDILEDEIMDIGDLLNSIDEEGNLAENEGETKPGEAVEGDEKASEPVEGGESEGNAASGEEAGKEEGEKKSKLPGFLQKIIKILFSTGEEKDGEEDKKEEEKKEAIDEEPPIDKKQAKKEEKERKKKEKEEAKKKAKEEKEKKAKEKPPKQPKQKKPKEPDKSPKIPLIAILAFVLLAASLVVLWFVTEKTVSYSLFVNGAKSSFDHQEYMEAYKKLSGVEDLDEEGLLLYNRAKSMAMLEYRINQYEMHVERSEHIYALDALVRGAVYYSAHEKEASELGIPSEYDNLGTTITERLETVYGLSMQDAKDLMALRDRKNYTRELYRILEREGLWRYEKR